MDEEHKVLQSVVEGFVNKEIQPISKNIETSGIPDSLKRKLSEQGFTGALAPNELGGTNLDRTGYLILLKELAKESPSVAFYVMMQNTYVINSLISGKDTVELIPDVAGGKKNFSFYLPHLTESKGADKLTINDEYIKGILRGFLNSNADNLIVKVGNDDFFVISEGFTVKEKDEQLGMRGMPMSTVEFDSSLKQSKRLKIDTVKLIESTYLPVSSIAIGIATGAISKSIHYADEREAFNHKLKDFQGISFRLSQTSSQLETLNNNLMLLSSMEPNPMKELMLKVSALDFAIEASKLALQVHGGYGYLSDFEIEKYYRDAMFLTVITSNFLMDREKLSSLIFGSNAGWI